MIPILEKGKLRPREVKLFARGHTAGRDPDIAGSLAAEFTLLATILGTIRKWLQLVDLCFSLDLSLPPVKWDVHVKVLAMGL